MVAPREHHKHPVGENHIIPHPWRAGCRMTIDTTGWDEDLIHGEATWCYMVVRVLLSTIPTVWQPCWDEVLPASAINNKMQRGPLQPQLWMKQALPLFRICWFFQTPLLNFALNKFPTNVCNRRIKSSTLSFFFSSAMDGFLGEWERMSFRETISRPNLLYSDLVGHMRWKMIKSSILWYHWSGLFLRTKWSGNVTMKYT